MASEHARIAENVDAIRERIAAAVARSGRQASTVELVAISKYVDAGRVRDLVSAGCHHLGESRPQALWDKATELADLDIKWHMVGHLQRNKIRRTLPHCHLIHSGDSVRLLTSINDEAGRIERVIDVLLEVNVSGDPEKHGFQPTEVAPALAELSQLANIRISGLMAMAARGTSPEEARRDFVALRELQDELRPNCPDNICLDQLSMGMSNDFEVAIEEGATIVRVGSALFAGLGQ